MKLSDLTQNVKSSNRESWNYSKIHDFFTNEKNKKHELLDFSNFDQIKAEISKVEKSYFVTLKSDIEPKKGLRRDLRKMFQKLEHLFVTETKKENKLLILQIIKAFKANFGTTQKINPDLSKEL